MNIWAATLRTRAHLFNQPGDRLLEADKECKMKTTRIMLAALAFIAVAQAQDVTTNYDQNTNFSVYKTYKWVTMPGSLNADSILSRQLTQDVDANLAKKGFIKVDSENADLYLGIQMATSQQHQLNYYGSGGFGWGGGFGNATTSTLTVGSFSLDMYDSKAKLMVWRGMATKTIDMNASAEKRQNNIRNGVNKLLKNFPPKRK
jgi:Domain of unknown function (DUF4136)